MPDSKIQAACSTYGARYRAATKGCERCSVNEQFQTQLDELTAEAASQLSTLRTEAVAAAEDLPQKRKIHKQIVDLEADVQDAADLIRLIEQRAAEDTRTSLQEQIAAKRSRYNDLRKKLKARLEKYTDLATQLASVLTEVREITVQSSALFSECERFEKLGIADATVGIATLGILKDIGPLHESVELPTVDPRGGVAIWGHLVTGDPRPPRPEVPPEPDEFSGTVSERRPGGGRRVQSPLPGSHADQARLAEIAKERERRKAALKAAAEWDREYAGK